MATMQDLATAVSTDAAKVAADAAAVAAAEATQTADTTAQTTDETTFAGALASTGPIAVVSSDGTSVAVYAASSTPPGYTSTSYAVASSVAAPTAS